MQRADNLFAAASLVLLTIGLAGQSLLRGHDLTVTGPHATYFIPMQTPLYAVAGLFGLFAFLYSIRYVPLGQAWAQWHFWLSLTGLILCAAGLTALDSLGNSLGRAPATQPSGGTSVWLTALSLLGGLLLFLLAQGCFAIGLARALIGMRHP